MKVLLAEDLLLVLLVEEEGVHSLHFFVAQVLRQASPPLRFGEPATVAIHELLVNIVFAGNQTLRSIPLCEVRLWQFAHRWLLGFGLNLLWQCREELRLRFVHILLDAEHLM